MPEALVMTVSAPRWHEPVMVDEVLARLDPRPGETIVDATAGTGGHGLAIAPRLLPGGLLIAVDQDEQAVALAGGRLAEFSPQARVLHGNFRDLPRLLQEQGLQAVDGLLLDLGVSSLHLEESERGFSFLREGPLDMRMDLSRGRPASSLVNELPQDELARLLETFGEERFARRIAQRLVAAREREPFTTTTQLARAVALAIPAGARHGRLHAATRTFQALRIAVNDELGALADVLEAAPRLLRHPGPTGADGGRLVVLTYHSLEDRLVKRALLAGKQGGWWRVLTPKPLTPSRAERARNPRARSAKLRAAERL